MLRRLHGHGVHQLRHGPGRHEAPAARPARAARLQQSAAERLLRQAAVGEHVRVLPLAAGLVQARVHLLRHHVAVGGDVDAPAVRQLPAADQRGHSGRAAGHDHRARLRVHRDPEVRQRAGLPAGLPGDPGARGGHLPADQGVRAPHGCRPHGHRRGADGNGGGSQWRQRGGRRRGPGRIRQYRIAGEEFARDGGGAPEDRGGLPAVDVQLVLLSGGGSRRSWMRFLYESKLFIECFFIYINGLVLELK